MATQGPGKEPPVRTSPPARGESTGRLPPQTGKQRAIRIPLDYYKHPDQLEKWKRRLLVLAPLLVVGWWGSSLLRSDQGRGHYSRGPVAAVHATWDSQCDACHISFTPINGDNWLTSWLGQPAITDQKCANCHAGTIHHPNQKPEDTSTCGGCHRDHRGRDASLTHLDNSYCTHCHQDLDHHLKDGTTTFATQITRFDAGPHPQFRILANPNPEDPGKLKFNHKLHLTAGMNCGFTLGRLSPADQERYRQGQADGQAAALLHLQCVSCHRLDGGDFKINDEHLAGLPRNALYPPRSPGAYMLPITYENQCAACHPLTLERKEPGNLKSELLSVRHRLQPNELHDFLQGYYTDKYLEDHVEVFQKFVPVRPLPGKLPAKETEEVKNLIQEKVEKAERDLYLGKRTCGECHEYVSDPGMVTPKAIVATEVPDIWFKHAVFNHAAHRAVDCRQCHEQAFPDSPNASTTSKDVLVPGIQTCVACHGPASHDSGIARGGARFDCTECHRYHNGDTPLQGIGAAARGPRVQGRVK